MPTMNDIVYDYLFFARKFSQIKWMMFLSQSLLMPEVDLSELGKAALTALNQRKQRIQEDAASMHQSLSEVCRRCQGYCCMKSYDHFSALDYWMRKYSASPILGYGIEFFEPWYVYIIRYRLSFKMFPKPHVENNGCTHLTPEGCNIDASERPIRCIAFTCGEFRKTADRKTKKEYARIIMELYTVCHDTFRILKKEAGVPKFYGELSILMRP